MVKTGGTLSSRMIELVGDLNETKTLANIKRSIRSIEKSLQQQDTKLKINAELFGRVEDIRKDVRSIQKKIDSSPQIKKIKLGVELGATTKKDINAQIKSVQTAVDSGGVSKLKLDIDFNFKGSASKIKAEMKEIHDFVKRFSNELKGVDVVNLDKDAQNVKQNTDKMDTSIRDLGRGTKVISDEIEGQMREMTGATGKFSMSFKRDVDGAITGATSSIAKADGTVEKFNYTLNKSGDALDMKSRATKEVSASMKDLEAHAKRVEAGQKALNKAMANSPKGLHDDLLKQAESHLKLASATDKSGRYTSEANDHMAKFTTTMTQLSGNLDRNKIHEKFEKMERSTREAIQEFERLGGTSDDVKRFEESIRRMGDGSIKEMEDLERQVKEATRAVVDSSQRIDKAMDSMTKQRMVKAVDEKDINALKNYVEEIYGARVETIKLSETKDKLGRSVDRMNVSMKQDGDTVKSYTLDMEKGYKNADRAIRQTSESTKTLKQSTGQLDGTFQKLALRIAEYFSVITVIQTTVRGVKATVREIMEIDKQMTELRRVASPSINTDVILERSVELSKELGSSVEQVVGSIADMARTFGDFNEEQLVAITRTASIMDNVSDLNLEQSTGTLVGAMKAFNITAEDSIRVVNSLNEVDNNYAISTQQLADAVNRTGSAARTFGVDLEELAGDITAIGSITQESGQRIGTALRTIYSRITTIDAVRPALEGIGISLYEMGDSGPQIREVSDILGELGGKWQDLNAEQQQNIGVTVAGRARVTQFLALMNNYQTAIDATTTAYNSQGSAIREQKAYMDSYEYQMKVMGSTATDLALTLEDKFVGDALYLAISAITDLLEVTELVIDKFGVLGPVLAVAGGAWLKFGGGMKTTLDAMTSLSTGLTGKGGLLGSIGNLAGKLVTGANKTGLLGLAFKGLASGGIMVAIVAIGWLIEKLVSYFAEQKRLSDEAKRVTQEAVDQYNEQGQNIDKLVDRYEELNRKMRDNKDALSIEEQQEYNDLVNKLSTMLPQTIDYVDAQGQAHLRSVDYIREQIVVLDELAEANARLVLDGQDEEFRKQVEDIQKLTNDIEKMRKEVEGHKTEAIETYEEHVARMKSLNQEAMPEDLFNQIEEAGLKTNAYAETVTDLTNKTYLLQKSIQEATLTVGDNVISLMRSRGEMENITTAGESVIRNYSSMNSAIIENADSVEEGTNTLVNNTEKFGEIVRETYDEISEGMNGIDPTRAIESFDLLVKALPKDFFLQEIEEIEVGMDSLGGVITDVMQGAEIDVDAMIQSLVNSGIEMDMARTIVSNLGTEFENQSIKTAIAEEELVQYNEELARTRDLAIETIDPLESLFGVNNEEIAGIESHVKTLQIMRQEYGDTWSEMERSQPLISMLADTFGQSEQFIVNNLDSITKTIRGLGETTVEWSEESQQYVWSFDESVDSSTQKMIKSFLAQGDGYRGLVNEVASYHGVVVESQEDIEARTKLLNEVFNDFGNVPEENNFQRILTTLNSQLEELDGTFATTEDSAGNLKLVMADGTKSEYLDTLNEQMKLYDMELEIMYDSTGEFRELMLVGPDGELTFISEINEQTEHGHLAIPKLQEAVKALKNESTSDEDRETYLSVLNTQMSTFGDGIKTVKDESGELKLAYSDGSSSAWLDALNESIENYNLKIETSEDKTGVVKLLLKNEEGETLFTGAMDDAGNLNETLDDTEEKAKKLRKALGGGQNRSETSASDPHSGPMAIHIDSGEAVRTMDELSTKADEITKDKEIDFKINPESVKSYNDIVGKLTGTKAELRDIQGELDQMERDLRVAGENLETIMANISTISEARHAVRDLIDDIKNAKNELGLLYEQFAKGNLDTTALTNASQSISDEATAIKDSFNQIVTAIRKTKEEINNMAPSFNVVPVTKYRIGVEQSTTGVMVALSKMANGTNTYMKMISGMYQDNLNKLVTYRIQSDMQVKLVMRTFTKFSEYMDETMTFVDRTMTTKFMKAVMQVLKASQMFNAVMKKNMQNLRKSTVDEITTMSKQMVNRFKAGTNTIVGIASGLPRRIGMGIRQNMESATSSMSALANNMVKRFKQALGIHSPSRVFESLGGYVIDGLVNGLTNGNITELGQNVFSDFSDGAIKTIDEIKGYMTFEPVTSGSFGSEFRRTSSYGGRSSPGGVGSTNHKGVDYGAPAGTPIRSQSSGRVIASGYNGTRGNYVIVESQGARHLYQHNSANYVRSGQMIGKGDVLGAVGSTGASTGPHLHYEIHINGVPVDPENYLKKFRGYANGGFVDSPELAWHGEEGLEAIIPLIPSRRDRGIDLWGQAGEKLGMNAEMLELLLKSQRRTASYGGTTSFAGLSGEAGSGDSDSGTSGIVKPSVDSVVRTLGIADQPMFAGMADGNDMEALYRRNMDEIRLNRHNAMITRANTELSALTEQTLEYRNALKEVTLQETRLRNETQKQLTATVKRQAQIEKELGKLRNTSKHTESQRKKYNELQQEFDKNTESIYSMENQLRQLNIAMDERKVAIYSDYIGQLTTGFEELKQGIAETRTDLEFALERTKLTDENDIGKQLEIQYDILKESIRLENTLMNNMKKLQSEYSRAVSRYGKNSEQALLVKEESRAVEEEYQGALIERLNLEQAIEGVRADVADEGIDNLKDYYKQTQTMTERAIEAERKALEKSHEDKMSMYDEEIAKIASIYDTRLSEMDENRAEEEYQESIASLNAQRADLMKQISRASRDNSLEGKKRLAEFQTELAEVNAEIETTQRERQDDLYRQSIERQRDEQIQALELEKQREEQEQESRLTSLDKQIEDAKAYTERMVGDEAMWKNVKDQFVAGNTNLLVSMMEEMTGNMSRFMSGNYNGISMGYDDLSDEDKAQFSEDTLMEISNMMLNASDSMEKFSSTANKAVENIGYVSGGNYSAGSMTTWSGSTLSTQGQLSPNLPKAPAPAPKPKADNRHHTVSRGDTLWDIAQKYYGNPYMWTKIAQANANPDPRKLQIGRRLLVPFKTGGFTGDWVGDAGRLAILHKKELVLNENQTKDILNVTKVVDGIMGIIPKLQVNRPSLSTSGSGGAGDTYVIDNLNLNMNDFKGSRKDAENAFNNMAKELKKRGRRN